MTNIAPSLMNITTHFRPMQWTDKNKMLTNINNNKELITCFKKKVSTNEIPWLSINANNIDSHHS